MQNGLTMIFLHPGAFVAGAFVDGAFVTGAFVAGAFVMPSFYAMLQLQLETDLTAS